MIHTHVGTALFTIILVAFAFLQEQKPARAPDTRKNGPCVFSGSGEVTVVENCILRAESGDVTITPAVVKQLRFDSHGLAQVGWADGPRHPWMYVNRSGRVVIGGVPIFDNWADDFSDGVVRTVVDGKYGFANRRGRIVIKPAYDWASAFHRGYAQACNHCREICETHAGTAEEVSVSEGCDHRIMVGGEWLRLNKKGRIVERLQR